MTLRLIPIQPDDLSQYKTDMQVAFQQGAVEGGFPADEPILPEEDIDRSLHTPGAVAYKCMDGSHMVGGAIVVIDGANGVGHLDFLYVKHGIQSRGIGKFIWFALEHLYPQVTMWETCTPHFEKRNIHFYINVCGFVATAFYNAHYRDPHTPPDSPLDDDGMLVFKKFMKKKG